MDNAGDGRDRTLPNLDVEERSRQRRCSAANIDWIVQEVDAMHLELFNFQAVCPP